MSNDFTFCFDLSVGSSPTEQVGLPSGRPDLHGPFAPAPLQGLHSYYRPSRPCASRYSALTEFAVWVSPSCVQGADIAHFDWPSVSRRQVLHFHASACDELTPPIHRTPPRPHAGRSLAEDTPKGVPLSRGPGPILGFGAV